MRGKFFDFLSKKGGGKARGTRVNSTVYVFAALTLVSIILLMFSSTRFIVGVKNAGLSIFFGIRGGVYEVSSFVTRTILSVSQLADLRREHAELLKQLERFEELERATAEVYQENIRLRQQLDFSKTLRYHRIPASISGRDPNNLFSAMVINKGSYAGVKNDMTVVAWQDGIQALVGKVIQSGAFESLVMPVFDVNSQISSRFTVSRFEGIVEGQGSAENPLLMRFVPKRALSNINIGDIIATSGMGGIFPANINIGRVKSVNALERQNTLEVFVEPFIDFSRLEYIFVIEEEIDPDADDSVTTEAGLE